MALQLFAHLEGEALNVALLMPEDQRDSLDGLSKALSEYYNSPGRLAIFRRNFDNVSRRDGEDPASFATELEILTVRGFGEVGQKARTRMVWDRFILRQRDCDLRHHLDRVPPDTPIRETVDQCRVWESHSPTPALEPEVTAAVIQDATDSSSSQREGDPDVSDRPTNCRDSREFLSKLVAALRQSVHQGILAELDTPPVALPEVGALLRHIGSPESTSTDIPSSGMRGTGMVCALVWTPLLLFCPRDGRLTSEKDNIGSCGPRFSRETPTDPGERVSLPDQ